MGHFIFVVLHIMAFLCGFFGLFITIPLHVIYAAMLSQNTNFGSNVVAVVKKSEPVNVGRLLGLCIRVVLIFIAGLILFGIFLRLYYKMYGRAPWQ